MSDVPVCTPTQHVWSHRTEIISSTPCDCGAVTLAEQWQMVYQRPPVNAFPFPSTNEGSEG